jgi:hypothetical protein
MKGHDNAPPEAIIESGFIYDIVTDTDSRWHWVHSEVQDVGYPDGRCEQGAAEYSQFRRFTSEPKLLTFMKDLLDPEDDYCPVRNLLGDWERFDRLSRWLDEMS